MTLPDIRIHQNPSGSTADSEPRAKRPQGARAGSRHPCPAAPFQTGFPPPKGGGCIPTVPA